MTDSTEPWVAEYETYGVEETLEPYPDQPVHQFLVDSADAHPDRGVVQYDRKVTYPELLAVVEALAAALQARGVEKGSRVATVLPTSVQFVIATNAISLAGGIHVPNDFLDAEEDLVHRLETGNPDVLIGRSDHRDLLETLRDRVGIDHLVLADVEANPSEPATRDSDRDVGSDEGVDSEEGVEWLSDVIDGSDGDPEPVEIDPAEDVHTILFTGGTTGRPKGCLLTHRNLVANALQSTAAQSRLPELMRGRESVVLALPMYHAYGYTVTNSMVELGLDLLVVPDGRDTEHMRSLVAEWEPLLMLGVPTQFMEIVEEDLDHDVFGVSGSAPLASETKAEFAERAGGIAQGYGLSEMSPVTHFNVAGIQEAITGPTDDDVGFDQPTIGVPVPDTSVKLVDVDSGEPVALREAVAEEREGELWVDGPQRMKGYLETADPFDEDGFVATGDVVKLDERGRFYVVDRVKNMINVSGLKVYTEEVDDVLYGMDGVRRPATVGVPDPDRPGSERVKIYVECDPGAELAADDVRSYLDGRVPRHAMPDELEFVEKVPTTDVGKTDRVALEERHEES